MRVLRNSIRVEVWILQ